MSFLLHLVEKGSRWLQSTGNDMTSDRERRSLLRRRPSSTFDVTPARLIAGIITEKGLLRPVTRAAIREVLG